MSDDLVLQLLPKEYTLISWLWKLAGWWGTWVPRSHETIKIETILERQPLPGHWTPLVSLRKRPICLSRRFCQRDRFLVWQTYRNWWQRSQGTEAIGNRLFALPLPCPSLLVSCRKELIPLSGALIFVAVTSRPLYSMVLVTSKAYTFGSNRTITNIEKVFK